VSAVDTTRASSDVVADLERAADVYDHVTWCREIYNAANKGCCPVGAIIYAVWGTFIPLSAPGTPKMIRVWNAERALTRYLRTHVASGLCDAMEWNDTTCRGREDAQQVLRAAATWYREQQW
jgi:hypothetical protein